MSTVSSNFAALAVRLTERARSLGEARSAQRRLVPRDPARWRNPRWLWPLFTKG
jgi:hypothetical protein